MKSVYNQYQVKRWTKEFHRDVWEKQYLTGRTCHQRSPELLSHIFLMDYWKKLFANREMETNI